MQSLDLLFLVVFISFHIRRYYFSQVFKSSFNIIWKKKNAFDKYSVFNGFTQTPLSSLATAKIREAWQKFFVNAL